MRGITFVLEGNGERVSFGTSGHDDFILKPGATGFRYADLDFATSQARGIPGSTVTDIEVGERELFMPLEVNGHSSADWREISQRLMRITSPLRVVGGRAHDGIKLTIESPWGARWIRGKRRFSSSAPWTNEEALYDVGREAIELRLLCEDPFFRSDLVSVEWETKTPRPFFGGGFPQQLSLTQEVNAARLMRVEGDAPPWPTWTVTGAVEGAGAVNATTGRRWQVDRRLQAGEVLVVRTDPNREGFAFTGPNNSNWFSATDVYPDLWPLHPGTENIRVVLVSPEPGSSVRMDYEPAWFGAL